MVKLEAKSSGEDPRATGCLVSGPGRAASGGPEPPRATGIGTQPLRISSPLFWSVLPAFLRSDVSSTRNQKSDIVVVRCHKIEWETSDFARNGRG